MTAAFTGGIAHPPGYPLYSLLAGLFAHLPVGEPAAGVNLLSALAAAAAVVLIYKAGRLAEKKAARGRCCVTEVSAASAALAFAFSPIFWSQATIAEVYALNALLVAGLLAVLLSELPNRLMIAAGIFGLGLAHHFSMILLAPSALLLLMGYPWTRTQTAQAILVLLGPLMLYLYLPIRALADPPVNWGNPRTLENFLWTVSAAPYRPYLFALSPTDVMDRAADAARFLFQEFNGWGVALGLWGVVRWVQIQDRRARREIMALALGVALQTVYAIVYGSRDSYIYLLPAFAVFTLWMAYGIGDLVNQVVSSRLRAVLFGALVLFPAYNLVTNFSSMDVSHDREAIDYAQATLAATPRDAVILADGDEHLFGLLYYRYVIARESSNVAVVSPELLQYDWYYDEIRAALPALDLSRVGPSDRTRIGEIVGQSLAHGREVYATARAEWFTDYVTERQGSLYWIRTRRQ